jgi:hypothetical protein
MLGLTEKKHKHPVGTTAWTKSLKRSFPDTNQKYHPSTAMLG